MTDDLINGKAVRHIASAASGDGKLSSQLIPFIDQQDIRFFSAAAIAAISPEGPPPMTITS